MSRSIKKVTVEVNTITIEFSGGRTLTAPTDFFNFISHQVASKPWDIISLVKDDEHRIGIDEVRNFPSDEERQTIWFETRHLNGGCGITTAWYWYNNPDRIGESIKGQRLPNGQRVSDEHIVLP